MCLWLAAANSVVELTFLRKLLQTNVAFGLCCLEPHMPMQVNSWAVILGQEVARVSAPYGEKIKTC